MIDQACLLQQHHPGKSSDQKAAPERHKHRENQQPAQPRPSIGDGISQGIAKYYAEQRDRTTDDKRVRQRAHIERLVDQGPKVLQAPDRIRKTAQQKLAYGIDEGDDQYGGRRRADPASDMLKAGYGA